jgi:hypothetical protein
MNEQERKRIEGLCRYIGDKVLLVQKKEGDYWIQVSMCEYCCIPKYRRNKGKTCPGANGKHACSTELKKWFVGEVKNDNI